ncbi:2779_t:CDS:2 [Cetraspora pellucida]|uniref:2779_t:CDS:1 n=1 Tax=Cetraspora pellucida TaxID=1433469 RepID=A0A9N9EEV6_9GLOM|nr:2779_t:CDS:2 [Cetraspora pellucida]
MNYSSIEVIERSHKIFDYAEFSQSEEIGQGGFAKVEKCYWDDFKCHVAIKSIKTGNNSEVIREIKIFKKISHHRNIIKLYGITKSK